jgi:alpha-glucosidase
MHSYAVIEKKRDTNVSFTEHDNYIVAGYSDIELRVYKASCKIELYDSNQLIYSGEIYPDTKNEALLVAAAYNNERFFGLGEKAGDFELTNREFTMYNQDNFGYTYDTDPLYATIPFYIAITDNNQYGIFFDSPARARFSFKASDYSYSIDDKAFDLYIFAGDAKKIIEDYTKLTGRPYFPPIWGFGFHQSRWSYESQEEVLKIASNFKDYDLPLDAIYLDIGFMNNNMVFTYDSDDYPNPSEMNNILKANGIKTVAMVDPGIKVESTYPIYNSGVENDVFCRYEGSYYTGDVWPGKCHFPDFTKSSVREWWGGLYANLLDLGIAGFWNDMNEPTIFNVESNKTMPDMVQMYNEGEESYQKYLHNAYGMSMVRASHEGIQSLTQKRVFLLSRSAYSGIQRYSFLWTGDNTADWDHLKMNLYMAMNLGLSVIPYVGADIGGFLNSPTEELFARWIQLGVFIPYMRDHTCIGTEYQEPYLFTGCLDITRKYMKLRYKLLPYLYTAVYQSHNTGLPIVRPLFLEYGRDYLDIQNQFMFGKDFVVAPVLEPGTTSREVTLPTGIWYEYFSGETYGAGTHKLDITIEDIPIFVRGGSIIPIYDFEIKSTDDLRSKRDLTLRVYPDSEGYAECSVYEDDGESFDYQQGLFLNTAVQYKADRRHAEITISTDGDFDIARQITIELPDNIDSVTINGKPYEVENHKVVF